MVLDPVDKKGTRDRNEDMRIKYRTKGNMEQKSSPGECTDSF